MRTLKSTGRGSRILPHGVLFRGNAEAEIRKNLIQRGLIQGIIGLPANLSTVLQVRPDGWRGVQAKEQLIKAALYGVLQDQAEVERLFAVVLAQPDY